jgi:hypothetical protein
MAGVIIPSVTVTIIDQSTVSSPNFTGDISLADRTKNGTDTATGVIDLITVTGTPDGIAGDITADPQFTTITAALKGMPGQKTRFTLPPLYRTAVSRSRSV